MDDVEGLGRDLTRISCPSGHLVPGGQAFCGVCGKDARSAAVGVPVEQQASGMPGRQFVVPATLAGLTVAIGIAISVSRSSGDSGELPQEVDPPPTMQEVCVGELVGIVEPMVAEFASTGQYGSTQQQALGQYGYEHPAFILAMREVLPQALTVSLTSGISAGLESARTVAEAACQEELGDATTP